MNRIIIITITCICTCVIALSSLVGQNTSISTADYVGIGLDNPVYPLQIFKNSSNHVYLSFTNLTTGSTSGDGVLVGIDPNEDFRIHSFENNDLRFHTNNLFKMILKGDGRLGLGLENPQTEFHIVDNAVDADNDVTLRLQSNSSNNDALIEFYENSAAAMSLHYDGGVNRLFLKDLTKDPVETRVSFERDGNVGIGTDNPATEMHIVDNADSDGDARLRLQSTGTDNSSMIQFYENTIGRMSLHYDGADDRLYLKDLLSIPSEKVTFTRTGNVGINIADPSEGLHIHSRNLLITDDASNNAIRLDANGAGSFAGEISVFDADGDQTIVLRGAESASTGASVSLRNATGVETIELDAEFGGVGRVITDELEIKGGSDLSEYFDINSSDNAQILPGMVVCIAPDGSGNLQLSTQAYDKTVAGVISGANGVRTGLMMGQQSSIAHGSTPVVLAGRAYVWADATYGAIQPGDLLTTSANPGHVMKVSDYTLAQGAVLGKAMTGLENGSGYVLVLVNLH